MSEKVKIRKISHPWAEYDCSSARNLPKTLQWLDKNTRQPHDLSVYVDSFIIEWGLKDPSREKIGWLLESPQINERLEKMDGCRMFSWRPDRPRGTQGRLDV